MGGAPGSFPGMNASFEAIMNIVRHETSVGRDARYATLQLIQYGCRYEISVRTQGLTHDHACSHLSKCASR
jgi:anti-sigma regulatory factor (Ser/Thr protein kinase)